MAAATATAAKIDQQQNIAPRVYRRRRKRRNVTIIRSIFCVLGVLFLLAYIGVYAQVTLYGYHISELQRQIRQVDMENQALQADIHTLSSPERLAAVAVAVGMQPSTQSVFISAPESTTVAKAD